MRPTSDSGRGAGRQHSVTALGMLSRIGLTSDEVLVRLRPLVPETVRVKPAPRWLRAFMNPRVSAITLPWAVYLRAEVMALPEAVLGRLMLHELVHARQWKELGTLRFTVRYLREYLAGRRRGLGHWGSYLAISLEQEAARAESILES